jgi:hypothetical protein
MFRSRTTRPCRRRETSHSRLESAVRRVLEPLESRMMLSVTITPPVNWVEQGPAPMTDGDIKVSNDAGAVEDIALNPALPNLAYIATTNGGIWKTTNLLAERPTWTPQTDFMPSMSMGSIAMSPLDPSGATVYAGLGSFSSFRRTGGLLLGLMRTTDGGAHWQNFLGNGESSTFFNAKQLSVRTVVPTEVDAAGNQATGVDNQVVMLAVVDDNTDLKKAISKTNVDNGGIYRSTDGGRTMTRVLDGSATDIIADPADKKRFYAAINHGGSQGAAGIYQSVDGGAHWTLKNTGLAAADLAKLYRIDLEASDAAGHPIYAAIIHEEKVGKSTHHDVHGIFRLETPTGSWARITAVPNVNPGHQADVHFSMATDPNDSRVVYIAGDRAADDVKGNVHRGETSGNTWTDTLLSGENNAATGKTSPHADSRAMHVVTGTDGKKFLVEGDDGGVYRFQLNASAPTTPTWQPVNYGLGVTEIVSVAWDSINKTLLSGNQDNGSSAQFPLNNGVDDDGDGLIDAADPDERLVWKHVIGGDGFSVAYAREVIGANWYTLQNNFDFFYRVPFNDDGTMVSFVNGLGDTVFTQVNLALAKPGKKVEYFDNGNQTVATADVALSGLVYQDRKKSKDREAFDAPMVVNAIDPARILLGYVGLYESEDRGDHISIVDNGLTPSGKEKERIKALAYGGTGNAAVIYAARGDTITVSEAAASKGKSRVIKHYVVEQKDANGKVIAGAAAIQDIVVDPDDWRTVYVIDTNQAFKSTDAGKTWVSLTGNAVAAPGTFYSLAVIKPSAASTDRILVIGTSSGLFFGREANGTMSPTHMLGQNLPHALVKDVQYVPADDVLIVGTLGRGAWKLDHCTGDDDGRRGRRAHRRDQCRRPDRHFGQRRQHQPAHRHDQRRTGRDVRPAHAGRDSGLRRRRRRHD